MTQDQALAQALADLNSNLDEMVALSRPEAYDRMSLGRLLEHIERCARQAHQIGDNYTALRSAMLGLEIL